ncbi:hypothetical protein PAXINDRAFT_21712 [Paxillus involutus ATCC 200175]|uniref:Uncharacterized protein n=1 Tax=Paxillus involutus ATCC 200175 TaxID=664439 RepID=A0A0C9SLU0_PAXIN|nr:hypothetical protein PAXINDRAFT_21712 [Paxillus involutus ATCC 200175]
MKGGADRRYPLTVPLQRIRPHSHWLEVELPFNRKLHLAPSSDEEERDAERIGNTFHPTFSPTPSAPSVLFNARQYPVGLPPVDMSTSPQLVALVNADVRGPVYRQGNEWVDGQDASQIDHTLSIRDFLITSLAWNPHRHIFDEVTARPPTRSHHRLVIL